uniref:Uncharacterized protein n=1 Tax=Rhizophora mucronata TaxID=61149 RepID=A0A2P2PPD6_RHIMU
MIQTCFPTVLNIIHPQKS